MYLYFTMGKKCHKGQLAKNVNRCLVEIGRCSRRKDLTLTPLKFATLLRLVCVGNCFIKLLGYRFTFSSHSIITYQATACTMNTIKIGYHSYV